MNFFNDDFGLGDSPRKVPPKNTSKKSQTNKSVKGADDFDDLLDQLLDKQKKKTSKQKQKQPQITSFTSLSNFDKSPAKPSSVQQQKKWETTNNINVGFGIKNESVDVGKNYEPMRNRQSSKSIHDDKGSQDNRSIRSGATAKNSYAIGDNLDFLRIPSNVDNAVQPPSASVSLRGMMKPPLRKRNQSKFDSQTVQDELRSTNKLPQSVFPSLQQIQSINLMRPPLPKKDPSPPKLVPSAKNLQLSQSLPKNEVIQKQKIVYIKQESKNMREQFDKQLKIIKESHERQVTHLKQELQRQIKNSKQVKIKLMKQFQQERQKDRKLYENLSKKDSEKIKDLYEWQIKRKSSSYQLQIERLKKLCQLTSNSQTNSMSSHSLQAQKQNLKQKQKELNLRIRKLQSQQKFLKEKQQALQTRQHQFDMYMKKQEQRIEDEMKKIYGLQNQFQRKRLEQRKESQNQKMEMVSSVSKIELELQRQREQLKVEKQELQMERQLFDRQKKQYEEFNNNILRQYKRKLKQLQQQRRYFQQKQIELFKKIHTVEMMGDLKAGIRRHSKLDQQNKNKVNIGKPQPSGDTVPKTQKHPQNVHQDLQSQFQIHTFSPPHAHDENLSKQKQGELGNAKNDQNARRSSLIYEKTNLKQYLLKVNRDNIRMRPFLA